MVLGATKIDLDFSVNVMTGAGGRIMAVPEGIAIKRPEQNWRSSYSRFPVCE
jgi:hypothetical protein